MGTVPRLFDCSSGICALLGWTCFSWQTREIVVSRITTRSSWRDVDSSRIVSTIDMQREKTQERRGVRIRARRKTGVGEESGIQYPWSIAKFQPLELRFSLAGQGPRLLAWRPGHQMHSTTRAVKAKREKEMKKTNALRLPQTLSTHNQNPNRNQGSHHLKDGTRGTVRDWWPRGPVLLP